MNRTSFSSTLALTALGFAVAPLLVFAQSSAPSGQVAGLQYQKGNPQCRFIFATVKLSSGSPQITNLVPNPDKKATQNCYSNGEYVDLGGKSQPIPTEMSSALGTASGSFLQGFFSSLGQMLAQKLMGGGSGSGSGSSGSGSGSTWTESSGQKTNTSDQLIKDLEGGAFDTNIQTNTDIEEGGDYENLLQKFLDNTGLTNEDLGSTSGTPGENGATGSSDTTGTGAEDDGSPQTPSGEDSTSTRPPGIGSIRASDSGAVLTVDVSNPGENRGIIGFFGSSRSGTLQSASPINRLCSARPWSGSLVSRVIPDRFFDGLCTRLGYTPGGALADDGNGAVDTTEQERVIRGVEVLKRAKPSAETRGIKCEPSVIDRGASAQVRWSCDKSVLTDVVGFTPNETGAPTIVTPRSSSVYAIRCEDNFIAQCTVQVVNPQLNIWSEPAAPVLGRRTTVFWSAQDVASCAVDGPSFHETGVQGGASTVPITKPVEFTIACQSLSGATTTKTLTIDLAI